MVRGTSASVTIYKNVVWVPGACLPLCPSPGFPAAGPFPSRGPAAPFRRMGYGGIGHRANMAKPKRKRPAASQPRSWCRVRRCQPCSCGDRHKSESRPPSPLAWICLSSGGVIIRRRDHAARFNNLRASCTVAGRRPYRSQSSTTRLTSAAFEGASRTRSSRTLSSSPVLQ